MVAGYQFKVSNLDKVFWPDDGYTKADLINYYASIEQYILPHLKNRPTVITRYPDGINGKSFYQKNAPTYLPAWIKTYPWWSSDSNRHIDLILIEHPAALTWLANQACIEMHPWLSNCNTISYPDFIVFDLDPSPESQYKDLVEIALLLQKLLAQLGLASYPKTSGGDGLHIYVPIANLYTYPEVRLFAEKVVSLIVQTFPQTATIQRTVNKRGSKIYIDYLQNVIGKTICSPYSLRPRSGATASAPLSWDEVPYAQPQDFTIKTLPRRCHKIGDIFNHVLTDKQSLDKAMRELGIKKT